MNSEIKILMLLLQNKNEQFTIKKISERANINYKIAYEKIILLQKEGLINVKVFGNSKLCEFSGLFNEKVFETEYLRRKELFKNKDFLIIHNRLSEINFSFVALLFGSYAKGVATKHSDIDILAIGENEKEIRTTLNLLPDKIHLTVISYQQFTKMAKSKEFSVVGEAIKNNIILIGIEEYYRLLNNAR
ncbi:hypothetical protein GQ473_03190 [archaeon]|nr:hypothetical protein [archaeon]